MALRRRPYRRDLVWLGALLPLGVVGQAVLGGFTVRGALDYGWVMGHFALSMLILVAAVVLAWRAAHEPAELAERPTSDRSLVLSVRGLAALGAPDDLRRDRRHGRRAACGGLPGAEDQPPEL